MFREAFVREGFDFDFMYDWILKKQALKARLAENQAKQREEAKLQPRRPTHQPTHNAMNVDPDTRYKGDNKYVVTGNQTRGHSHIRDRNHEQANRGHSNIRDIGIRDALAQE